MNARSQRGSGILLAMIVMIVLSVLAVGIIRFSSRELAGAYAGRQHDALVACAEAGRQLLMSQFRAASMPISLTVLNAGLDNTNLATARTFAVGGHIDTAGVQIDQVRLLPEFTFGQTTRNVRDITNIVFPGRAGMGGKPYGVTVHCQDHPTPGDTTSGRQLEVEFGIRFGL